MTPEGSWKTARGRMTLGIRKQNNSSTPGEQEQSNAANPNFFAAREKMKRVPRGTPTKQQGSFRAAEPSGRMRTVQAPAEPRLNNILKTNHSLFFLRP